VIVDNSIWNGAVVGQVNWYQKHDTYLEAEVTVSNPKFFWTKLLIQNPHDVSIDPESLYANFGFLGPVSSTIPWEPGFATAKYNLRFDNETTINIGVDPTLNSGPEASFFNLAQIVLTAAPVPADALSLTTLSDMLEYIENTQELADIADTIFVQGNIISGTKSLVELALFQPEVLQPIYVKAGLQLGLDDIKAALSLWKMLDIIRQVSDQAYTYIFGNPSGYIIFKAVSLQVGDDDPYIIASFSANPQSAAPNLTIQFNASQSTAYKDTITSYEWSFGDGASDTTSSPIVTHAYSAKGFYTVHLTIHSSGGRSDSSQLTVSVGNAHLDGVIFNGGTLSTDTTWTAAEGHHLVKGSFNIPEGVTLTIEPGVKVELGGGVEINVQGTLTATGVTFTWADGGNEWTGIRFRDTGASGSRLENCTIEHANGAHPYASDEPPHTGVIYIWNASPTIINCTIGNSSALAGVWMRNSSSPVISGCSISGFTNSSHGYGILVDYGSVWGHSMPTVTGSMLSNNRYGIFIYSHSDGGMYRGNTISGNTSFGLYYSGSMVLDATNNNWGHPSGPLDSSDDRLSGGLYNPTGLGDKVSDHVNYYPWTGMTIGQTAIPTSLSGTASYNSVYLTWNANTEPYIGGYKIYYGTSSNNYNKSKIVGIVTSDTLTGLSNGTTYYIAISSLNSVGVESPKSAEITVTPKATFALSVTKSGNGSVSATGLACNGDICSGTYSYNTQVVITATPGEGSIVAWTGCNSTNGNQCTVTMNIDKNVTVTFSYTEYLLTVTKSGTGSGNVTDDKGKLTCNGNTCSGSYAVNTQVTLTAEADAGSAFTGWTSLCNGTGTCTITMDGAKGVTASFSDTEAPDLTISALSDGSWTNNETLNISGTATDNMGIESLTLTINGTPVILNPDGTFSHALTLIVGPNEINTIASDLAGLQTTDTRTINFDPTAPYIEITTPADNSKTKQSTIEVSGTVDESSMVTVKVNDYDPLPAQMNGNNFTLTVPLTYGINTIEVIATDLAGNNSSLKRTVTYDDHSPALSITEPSQDGKTNQSSMLIKGTVSDITTTTVKVTQDQEAFTPAVTNGSFEQLITFTIEKTYQIYVTATDELGNETTVQRNIIYDTTPPSLSIDAVTSPTNQNSQVLTGTVEATAEVTVFCPTADVGPVDYPTQTTWSVALTNMAEGNNLITVTAADEAGNVSGQMGAIIVVDTVAPDTAITSAPSNPSNSTSASFGFSSTDNNSTFRCQIDNGGYQPCTSPKAYTNLSVGSHTFYVGATDAAGNTEPFPASYTWTITQAQMPDLSGKWLSLMSRLRGRHITGTLQVTNAGNVNARKFNVTFYLSNDGINTSRVLRIVSVGSLKAGRSTNLSFTYNSLTSLSHKYIIAVIDSGNQIAETNENNNMAVSRIP